MRRFSHEEGQRTPFATVAQPVFANLPVCTSNVEKKHHTGKVRGLTVPCFVHKPTALMTGRAGRGWGNALGKAGGGDAPGDKSWETKWKKLGQAFSWQNFPP